MSRPTAVFVRMLTRAETPYLAVDHGLGQPEVQDGPVAARPRRRGSLEDVHRVPEQGGKVGAGQPCGAGADDGDPFSGRGKGLHAPEGGAVICGMPFQRADCHAFIVRIPVAAGFRRDGGIRGPVRRETDCGRAGIPARGPRCRPRWPVPFLNGVPCRTTAFTGDVRPVRRGWRPVRKRGLFSAEDWRHSDSLFQKKVLRRWSLLCPVAVERPYPAQGGASGWFRVRLAGPRPRKPWGRRHPFPEQAIC